jgi:hypothetical protein
MITNKKQTSQTFYLSCKLNMYIVYWCLTNYILKWIPFLYILSLFITKRLHKITYTQSCKWNLQKFHSTIHITEQNACQKAHFNSRGCALSTSACIFCLLHWTLCLKQYRKALQNDSQAQTSSHLKYALNIRIW